MSPDAPRPDPPLSRDFERLALPLQKDLYFAALALTRREPDALDLVQETLLKAFRGFASFTRGDNVKAWLFTILRHAYLDRCRQKRLDPLPLDPAAGEGPPAGPSAGRLPLHEVLSDELLAALRSLTPAHQMVLLLCDVEGLSYKQIAEVLGCPLGSVMSGLHNARTRLKAALVRSRPDAGP